MNIRTTSPTSKILGIGLIALFMGAISCVESKQRVADSFQVHPLFNLDLVASEPLIFDPVDMKFDEEGKAFVLEMPGYPLRDEESRIVLLSDKDGDGQFDERQVYASDLGVASSIMPYNGGFLVASPPHLLWVTDEDGDDIADRREIRMSGFSEGNLQHNFNGLTYGLDNWIYAANGGNSGEPYFALDSSSATDLRGDDFKFRLKPDQLERVGMSSGGFELAFDDWGRMFETHNLEHISHLNFETRYINHILTEPSHTLFNVSDHEENGLSRIYPIGEQETRVNHPEQSGYFSGACGITHYGGDAFPDGFNNSILVADCVLNLVHLDRLKENKASFTASRSRDKVEFIASSDRSFRPVNMASGPDGALYIIDMHRDVIEHPEWIPDDIETGLDLNAGKEKGRIYKITPKDKAALKPFSFKGLRHPDIIAALNHQNQWVRLTAQRLIVEANTLESSERLVKLFEESDNAEGRLHALWTLDGLHALPPEVLEKGLADPSPGVRENSLKISEEKLNDQKGLISIVLNLMDDPHPRVRMFAALVLSTLSNKDYDTYREEIVQHLIAMLSNEHIDQWETMAAAALGERASSEIVPALLTRSSDTITAQVVVFVSTLSRTLGQQQNIEAATQILDLLSSKLYSPHVTSTFIAALSEGWDRKQPDRPVFAASSNMIAPLEKLENRKSIPITRSCADFRIRLGLPASSSFNDLIAEALKTVQNRSLPVHQRLENLQLLSLAPYDAKSDILFIMLDNREPIPLQEEAINQLWQANHSSTGKQLVEVWSRLGPHARRISSDILLYNEKYHDALLTGLEEGQINIGEMNFDLERRRTLLWWTDDNNTKRRAQALFKDSGVVNRKEVMDQMKDALEMAGSVQEGRIVFSEQCGQCHIFGNEGQDVGPVLTEISRKSKASLLHDILDPNAAVDTKYINHILKTADGQTHIGIVSSETDREITIRKMGGASVTVPKGQIAEFSSLGTSLMMEGLEANMSHQDMADLLAYLQKPL